MGETTEDDTEQLLARAATGDVAATTALLARYRQRLKTMIAVRTSKRFATRFDESDIVQETLAAAAAQLTSYLENPKLPFYPWLRSLAERKLIEACRYHNRGRRAVGREHDLKSQEMGLPDHSAMELACRLVAPGITPSQAVGKREIRAQVQAALAQLGKHDREVLVLVHLERLTSAETAAVLGLTEEAVKSRRRRAILRLGSLLKHLKEELGG